MNRSTALTRQTRRTTRRDDLRGAGGAPARPTGKVAGALELMVLIAIAILLILGTVVTSTTRTVAPELSSLKVQAGDSLWSLAASHPVQGLSTSQVADLLAQANHLDDVSVVPGQSILVPCETPRQRFASR